jgi:hypothetical protein
MLNWLGPAYITQEDVVMKGVRCALVALKRGRIKQRNLMMANKRGFHTRDKIKDFAGHLIFVVQIIFNHLYYL